METNLQKIQGQNGYNFLNIEYLVTSQEVLYLLNVWQTQRLQIVGTDSKRETLNTLGTESL
jgi:hypothetical protein